MPDKHIYTQVEGQEVRLSNIDRIIYPGLKIPKAEIIQYYLSISDYILKYIKNRPLTLIRYPKGIDQEKFYAKTKPKWTPEWIDSFEITHTKENIAYIVPKRKADIVWLANLSALELHPMQFEIHDEDHPDHFILDLDPPEGSSFESVKEVALMLKDFLEELGYTPFVKTSGSKGAHILIPIVLGYTHEQMMESVKRLAGIFVKRYPKRSTLHINKSKRQDRILIDILRNHKGQTTVAPYSLRGKAGAPISMPMSWEDFQGLEFSNQITIKNYQDYLPQSIAAWSSFENSRVELHDRKKLDQNLDDLVKGKLKTYYEKRDFSQTSEPRVKQSQGPNNRYTIQLHDASNLHYDLRLEEDGSLLSWAIPKGLPVRPGVKRMAIRTEDHPLSYLHFEGIIPKGNYGAGEMWIFETGTFKWLEKKEKSYKIELSSGTQTRIFHLFQTKEDQWLIELKSVGLAKLDIANQFPVMLAESGEALLHGNYLYEIKWDGIRAMIHLEGGKVSITSRGKKDLTEKFPELQSIKSYLDVEQGIFDGEIVCLDDQGKPVFSNVISRMHTTGKQNIELKSKANKAVVYLFDCLMFDGKLITELPLYKRRAWLKASFKKQETYRLSESFENGSHLLEAVRKMGLEGIMMKTKDGKYMIGSRSTNWLKLKNRFKAKAYIIGYTKGKGDRSGLFGSLHLAIKNEDKLKYMGRVGTGFNSTQLEEYFKLFETYIDAAKPIDDKIEQEKDTVWMRPELLCEIKYASLTNNGGYREPVFIKLIETS